GGLDGYQLHGLERTAVVDADPPDDPVGEEGVAVAPLGEGAADVPGALDDRELVPGDGRLERGEHHHIQVGAAQVHGAGHVELVVVAGAVARGVAVDLDVQDGFAVERHRAAVEDAGAVARGDDPAAGAVEVAHRTNALERAAGEGDVGDRAVHLQGA